MGGVIEIRPSHQKHIQSRPPRTGFRRQQKQTMAYKHGVDTLITRLMLESALMLAELGRFDRAIFIINAVKAFRDEIPHPAVCLAVAYLYKGEAERAVEQLEATSAEFPGNPLVLAMLGTALRETGSPRWREVLDQVVASGVKDQWAMSLATTVREMQGTTGPDSPAAPFQARVLRHGARGLA